MLERFSYSQPKGKCYACGSEYLLGYLDLHLALCQEYKRKRAEEKAERVKPLENAIMAFTSAADMAYAEESTQVSEMLRVMAVGMRDIATYLKETD